MEFRDIFLKQKEAIQNRMAEILCMVRPEHMDWRPEKDALSMGEMLQHRWVSEEGVRRVLLQSDCAYYETRIRKGEEERVHPDLGIRRTVWVILLGINEHEVHHRAQLSTYLRILGTPVPDVAKSYQAGSRRT